MRLSERWRNGSTEAESDVAIIDLPIDDPHGTPIPLATEAEFSTLSQGKCVIVGHGLFEDQQSGKLVAGSAKFISAEKAKHKWLDVKVGPKPFEERYGNAVFTDATITKTQVGDSGGAVICQNKELKWIQVAVTSQRIGDDREFVKSYFDGTIEKTSVVNVAAPVFRPAAQLLLVPAASSSPSEPKASPAK